MCGVGIQSYSTASDAQAAATALNTPAIMSVKYELAVSTSDGTCSTALEGPRDIAIVGVSFLVFLAFCY